MVQAMAVNPLVAQSDAVLSDEEFAKFCEFFYRKTGIMFDAKKKYFAERRIIDRMNKTSCATFREYFSNVRFEASGAEMQRLGSTS
jgi:chemotaxis protein methyltransferase CheR